MWVYEYTVGDYIYLYIIYIHIYLCFVVYVHVCIERDGELLSDMGHLTCSHASFLLQPSCETLWSARPPIQRSWGAKPTRNGQGNFGFLPQLLAHADHNPSHAGRTACKTLESLASKSKDSVKRWKHGHAYALHTPQESMYGDTHVRLHLHLYTCTCVLCVYTYIYTWRERR